MKYYLYDEKTKQFLKEQEGYLDPLETKAQGKNVYIVPPFSTTEKPDLTSLKDNEILVFNGNKWQIEQEFYVGKIVDCQGERAVKYVTDNDLTFEPCDNGFKIVEKPLPKEKTLEELKEQKHAELKSIMQTRAAKIDEINTSKNYQLNTGGLEYEEDLFAYDDKALLRISGTILDWQDQISRGTVQPEDIVQPWISKANRVHPLSYDQLIELARLLRQEVQRIVFYGTYLEKLAQAATTLEELDAIVWDYGAASASGIIDRLIAGGNQDA